MALLTSFNETYNKVYSLFSETCAKLHIITYEETYKNYKILKIKKYPGSSHIKDFVETIEAIFEDIVDIIDDNFSLDSRDTISGITYVYNNFSVMYVEICKRFFKSLLDTNNGLFREFGGKIVISKKKTVKTVGIPDLTLRKTIFTNGIQTLEQIENDKLISILTTLTNGLTILKCGPDTVERMSKASQFSAEYVASQLPDNGE